MQLDHPETGQYQNAFLDAEEDSDFWDDDNFAAFLGVLDEQFPHIVSIKCVHECFFIKIMNCSSLDKKRSRTS